MLAVRRSIRVVPAAVIGRSQKLDQVAVFCNKPQPHPAPQPTNPNATPKSGGSPLSMASRIGQTYRHVLESNEFALAKQSVVWAFVRTGIAIKQCVALIVEHGPTLVRMAIPYVLKVIQLTVDLLRAGVHMIREHGPNYVRLLQALLVPMVQTLRSIDYKHGVKLICQQGPAYFQLAVCKARDAVHVARVMIPIYMRILQAFLVQGVQTVRSFDYKSAFVNAMQQIKSKMTNDSKQRKK